MATQTWKHKDVTIEFTANASFTALANGKRIMAPSLDAAKKRIDAALAVTFEPFDAIEPGRDVLDSFRVTGIERERRKYAADRVYFECSGPAYCRSRSSVIIDTPEHRKLVADYQKRAKEISEEKERLDEELQSMHEALPYVKAEDYAAGKSK